MHGDFQRKNVMLSRRVMPIVTKNLFTKDDLSLMVIDWETSD